MFYLSVFDIETLKRHNTFSKMDDFSVAVVPLPVCEHTGGAVAAARPKESISIKERSLACGPKLQLLNNSSLSTETYKAVL